MIILREICKLITLSITKLERIKLFTTNHLMLSSSEIYVPNCEIVDHYVNVIFNELSLFTICLVCIVLFLFTIECINGQAYRDYKSYQLARFLVRRALKPNQNLILSEETDANRWIKMLRIIRWKKKLMLIIPCMGSSMVVSVIKKRCEESLMDWLDGNFDNVNWTPLSVRSRGMITWLVVKEK